MSSLSCGSKYAALVFGWAWAERVFRRVAVPDSRLRKRVIQVASDWSRRPGLPLCRASVTATRAKGAYRLMAHRDVPPDALAQALFDDAAEISGELPRVFVSCDTTSLEFSHREPIDDLGPVTTSGAQGLLVHTCLALTPDGEPLGILDQKIWTRPDEKLPPKDERHPEDRESYKWEEGSLRARERLPEGCRPVFIFDREGDIHEVFTSARKHDYGVLVRSRTNRRVSAEEKYLWQTLEAQEAAHSYEFTVPRRRGSVPSRETILEVRFAPITLQPNCNKRPERGPVDLYGVLVTERDGPEKGTPLRWCLLTTEPVTTGEEAREIARIYSLRWRVEEYHLILKSGCRIESHQFEYGDRIRKAIVLLSGVALFLLRLTYLARLNPELPAHLAVTPVMLEALKRWASKTQRGQKRKCDTIADAVRLIGRMGGHMERKRDGPVGVRTLWRGWHDLDIMTQILDEPKTPPQTCG